jgi:thiol-disulfide isomerase/thioredoxin
MLSHKMDKGYPRPISEWGDVLKATTNAIKKVESLKKGIQFFEGSWEETLALSKKTGKPIFVNIYTSGFHVCRRIALNVFTDEKVADFYNKNFINVRIGDSAEDISTERHREFCKTHSWEYFPTRMYINGNNEELEVSDGCTSVYGLIDMGKKVLKKMK